MPNTRLRAGFGGKTPFIFMPNTHSIMPDVGGIFLMAGSWGPFLAIRLHSTDVAFGLSIAVSLLAFIDYLMKIHWKVTERKKTRRERKSDTGKLKNSKDERAN